jgi:Kdo2-lipid IVA lauroyltransferase/acyltransferase
MTFKEVTGRATFYLAKFMLFLTRIIPLRMSYSLCSFLAWLGTVIDWKRKAIAFRNLDIVFPEKSKDEKKSIFRESLKNMLKDYFEFAYFANGKFPLARIAAMADVTGLEHLDNQVRMKQGALLYSGHFGSFPLMIIWLAMRGYPIAAVYKEAKYFPDEFFGNILRKLNITPLKYRSEAALTVSIIKALKEGKIVFIQNDQSHPAGIYINFFNKSVPSPAGPALLAQRVGVPVIPSIIYRTKEDLHKITIFPELPLQQTEDQKKFLEVNTQIQIDWIAEMVVKHPDEWLWLHNRWKRSK